MYLERRIAVVIPAFNVASSLTDVVAGIPALVDEIIVVDDASTDGTTEVVSGLTDPRLTTVRHPANLGVGGAMVTGYRLALERGADVVVKMDGDGQMDSTHLPLLLNPILLDGCAYAKGNRFLEGESLRRMPKIRLAGNFALTFLTKLASGYWHVFDPTNGYVAITSTMLRKLPLDKIAPRYFFESDMLIKLNVLKARVSDVPMPSRYNDERSSMRFGRILLSFPLYLMTGFWYRIYERHVLREFSPVAMFWILGSLLLAWGTGFGAIEWIKSYRSGHAATTGTVMLSVLPLILGFQLVLHAILIEIQDSPR